MCLSFFNVAKRKFCEVRHGVCKKKLLNRNNCKNNKYYVFFDLVFLILRALYYMFNVNYSHLKRMGVVDLTYKTHPLS